MSGFFGSVIGAGITAGANIGGTIYSNEVAAERERAAREDNYRLNERAADNADARTRALYNDLYSPKAQLAQIKAAGLSPSLFYGDGGGISGQSGAMGAGTSGISPSSFGVPAMDFTQVAKQIAEIGLIKAQTNKTNTENDELLGETEKGRAEIDSIVAETNNKHLQGEMHALDITLKNFEVAIKGATGDTEIAIKQEELKRLTGEVRNIRALIRINEAEGRISEESADAIITYNRNRVIKQFAEIALAKAQKQLTEGQVELTAKQVEKLSNDILVDNANVEISRRKVSVDEKALEAQVNQWAIENGFTERKQQIAIWSMVAYLINDNNHEFLRTIEELIPIRQRKPISGLQ